MEYLRCRTREQNRGHRPFPKPYSLGRDTRGGRKLEGQDGELRKGAVRIGRRGKEGLELGWGGNWDMSPQF